MKDHYLAALVSRKSLSSNQPPEQQRIVMSSWGDEGEEPFPGIDIDWRWHDALDQIAWLACLYKDSDTEKICKVLGAVIVHKLEGWPAWFPQAPPEYERPGDVVVDGTMVRVCEIRLGLSMPFPHYDGHFRILHCEMAGSSGDPSYPVHFTRLELADTDGLGAPAWVCLNYDIGDSRAEPLPALLEAVVTLLGMRFGEKDHRQKLYKAELVPPSKYAPCECGSSRADDDYELVVSCRQCGNAIGPAQ